MKNTAASEIAVFWFRRDLRLEDNAGLYHALQCGLPVQCIFIFDTNILDALEDRDDARVEFIHDSLQELNASILKAGASGLWVFHGKPLDIWAYLVQRHVIRSVYFNRDYEPYARQRDEAVTTLLATRSIRSQSFKDHVLFEKKEIVKENGQPYTVFTPYKRRHLALLAATDLSPYPTENGMARLCPFEGANPYPLPELTKLGFQKGRIPFPPKDNHRQVLPGYSENRDFPARPGTSRLGIHLRFGTVSIRAMARDGLHNSEVWLSELIWRDFYFSILWHFPHVTEHAFKPEYDRIAWRNNEAEFAAWCAGKTGFPLVDAGMRQLAETGYMHNRVRMVTASFLSKDLLIDWRWGEAWFARKLLDYELASNNGGWQWAAGTGCDAAPYFRIFNPTEQLKKFDPNLEYVRRWIPEYDGLTFQLPIVDHKLARERCLRVYRDAITP